MRIARAAVLVLALVCCAWFALSARQAHETAQATSIVGAGRTVSAGQVRVAADQLSAAGTLNPDQEVNILRGRLALEEGRLARARLILEGVVRQEPQNLEAWIWLLQSTRGDPALFRTAIAHVHRLLVTPPPPRSG